MVKDSPIPLPMSEIFYILNPAHWMIPVKGLAERSNHNIIDYKNKKWLWPETVDGASINPKNFDELKTSFNITEITILDRWTGDDICSVKDQVNRSGIVGLRGKTPYKNRPQFPDVSNIYSPIEGYKMTTIHTVGPERFLTVKPEDRVGELCGIVAPVWYYIGVKVRALCAPQKKTKEFLFS